MRAIGAILGLGLAAWAHAAQFSEALGASWELVAGEAVCSLQHRLGDYGVARFTGVPGRPLRFEVIGHRDLFAPGPVDLFRVAPPWHADYPRDEALGQGSHLQGGGVSVADPLATRVLMALYDGFDTYLRRDGWYASGNDASADPTGEDVAVKVSSVNLRPLYERFVDCFKGVLSTSWADIERSRVDYPVNGWRIDEAGTARLEQVAAYVVADPWVSAVFIDGHTDALGSRGANYQLSKRRAETVAEFLEEHGVPGKLLTVRYHGAAYPVADNETDAGRARNRRTTVRLERNESEHGAGARPLASVGQLP